MKKIYLKYLGPSLFLICISLINFLFFTFLRLLFYLYNKNTNNNEILINELLKAFILGLKFDGVIIGYINSIALIIILIYFFLSKKKVLNTILFYYYIIITIPIYFFLIANIPYFSFFYTPITNAIFHWIDTPSIMIKQVLYDFNFLKFLMFYLLFLFIIISIIFFFKRSLVLQEQQNKKVQIIIFLLLVILNMYILRGGISAPLRENQAAFSKNSFLNQIPLNGVFTFIKSLDQKTIFFKTEEAIKTLEKFGYKFLNINNNYILYQKINFKEEPKYYNIIIIIMESISTYYTKFLSKNSLTYELDTIAEKGIVFTNCWSTGKHTSSGIFSTLYSYPTIWSKRPTSSIHKVQYCGLPGTLKKYNYYNVFFTTQDLTFDNLQEFLPRNHFDTLIGISFYNKEEVISIYGVADHTMFNYGLSYINNVLINKDKPFFVCFLTTTNHSPYTLPQNIEFIPKSKKKNEKTIEYTSWAIGKFIKECQKYEWFKKTLFVITSDHGFFYFNDNLPVPLCIHNIPLIFYNPFIIEKNQINNSLISQCDIFPTIMNFLKLPYIRNVFGINAFKEKRRFVAYSEDKYTIAQNDSFQIVISRTGKIINKGKIIKKISYSEKILEDMRKFALSEIQMANFFIEKKLVNCNQ